MLSLTLTNMKVKFFKTFHSEMRTILFSMAQTDSFRITGDCNTRRIHDQNKA